LRLWTIYVRLRHFVDPGLASRLKLLPGARQIRAWWKRSRGPSYEHNPVPLGDDLQREIGTIIAAGGSRGNAGSAPRVEIRDNRDPRSLAMALHHLGQANDLLGNLAAAFLRRQNHYVQYMTASRHPIEFIEHLRRSWDGATLKWEEVRARVVAVDAYTPHFGFMDSINGAKSDDLRKEIGVRLLPANETFAGLHSASSAAFNLVKTAAATPSMRQPTLVIYEDTYALSDLESVEQYRIFARHVLPSERLWNGMFTVFAETAQREDDWQLMSSYASLTLDLRLKDGQADEGKPHE
jgi:hypothetical protein